MSKGETVELKKIATTEGVEDEKGVENIVLRKIRAIKTGKQFSGVRANRM